MGLTFSAVRLVKRLTGTLPPETGDYILPPDLPAVGTATRYVDYAAGSDASDGLTPGTAWKHDPDDRNATGTPLAYTPVPGDIIAYKGGVRYRGILDFAASGTSSAPIQRVGSYPGFGTGAAIYDGATPVTTVRVATDSADAGGISNWNDADIRIVEHDAVPTGLTRAFFDNTGLIHKAQSPAPLDRYLYDDIQASDDVIYQVAVNNWSTTPTITDATIAGICAGQEGQIEAWVWVDGSQMSYQRVTLVEDNVVTLAGPLSDPPYTPTTRVFLRGDRKNLAAGTWAPLSDTKAVVRIRGGDTAIRIGRDINNGGTDRFIDLTGQSWITIRGFRFEAFVGNAQQADAIIKATSGTSDGIRIIENTFTDCTDDEGGFVCVHSSALRNQVITHNRFQNLSNFGAVLANSIGFQIEYNVFDRIGRTAFRMTSATGDDVDTNGVLRRNIFARLRGVHTNVISAYGAWKSWTIEENYVQASPRTLTTQGAPTGPSGRIIRNNVFVASSDGNGWGIWVNTGNVIDGMVISRNLSIAHNAGALLKKQLTNLMFTQNWGTDGTSGNGAGEGPGYAVDTPGTDNRATWTVSANQTIAPTYLSDVAAVQEVDRVNVLRPDGTRLALDLRSVGV